MGVMYNNLRLQDFYFADCTQNDPEKAISKAISKLIRKGSRKNSVPEPYKSVLDLDFKEELDKALKINIDDLFSVNKGEIRRDKEAKNCNENCNQVKALVYKVAFTNQDYVSYYREHIAPASAALVSYLLRSIKSNPENEFRLLDIGSGPGAPALQALQAKQNTYTSKKFRFSYVGIEESEQVFSTYGQYANAKFVKGHFPSKEVVDEVKSVGSYDVGVLGGIVDFLDEKSLAEFLDATASLLRPGARLVIYVPLNINQKYDSNVLLEQLNQRGFVNSAGAKLSARDEERLVVTSNKSFNNARFFFYALTAYNGNDLVKSLRH